MNKHLLQMFMRFNSLIIHASKGRLGAKLGKQTILLMHTVGRKSGKKYTTPIAYFTIENSYYVIGSNWGQEKNASWYFNLKENPNLTIEVKGREIPVHAREAEGDEYEQLWAEAVARHPDYLHYKAMTTRHIPIIVFTPVHTT